MCDLDNLFPYIVEEDMVYLEKITLSCLRHDKERNLNVMLTFYLYRINNFLLLMLTTELI